MTATAPPLLPHERPSRSDRWLRRLRTDPVLARRVDVLAPVLLTVFAGLLRLVGLGHPRALVFDETYYVKDAWSQWLLGYTASWPEGADTAFVDGVVDGFDIAPSFSVHPPLGKWLIGLGMWLVGPEHPFGWRLMTAVAGTTLVLLVYLVTRMLTRSTPLATLAGFLLAIDGVGIVLSRVGLLDVFLACFSLLACWFVLLDQRQHIARLTRAVAGRAAPMWGPLRWSRPWLLAAGAAAGAACAVKWSGLYVLAALGLYVVVVDALVRRRLGIRMWPTDAVRQGAAAFVLLVPVAVVVYLASWTGWLVSDGGYDRRSADGDPATGFWAWVPLPLQSLWHFHVAIYRFHVGLSTPHGYESPAWQWPLLVRPTSMFWEQDDQGVQAISSIPNPLIWWAGVAAVLYVLYRFVRTRRVEHAFVLAGVAATYVPWLLYPERTIFQFYTVAVAPFLVIAIALAVRDLLATRDPDRRLAVRRTVVVFTVLATLLSAFWYPVWVAADVPYGFWRLHNWLPTWV
ncbi:dolichyl-phosphate-mannose--protein mannosyltransferase [Microbacterium sp. GXF7504]